MTGVEPEQFLELIDHDEEVFVLLEAQLPGGLDEPESAADEGGLDVEFGEVFAAGVIEQGGLMQRGSEIADGASAGAHEGDLPV